MCDVCSATYNVKSYIKTEIKYSINKGLQKQNIHLSIRIK